MIALPSLQQLRFFVAVAEQRHFGRAAAACGVTQSTLSAGIQELEARLGVALIERSRRGVVLTAIGESRAGARAAPARRCRGSRGAGAKRPRAADPTAAARRHPDDRALSRAGDHARPQQDLSEAAALSARGANRAAAGAARRRQARPRAARPALCDGRIRNPGARQRSDRSGVAEGSPTRQPQDNPRRRARRREAAAHGRRTLPQEPRPRSLPPDPRRPERGISKARACAPSCKWRPAGWA